METPPNVNPARASGPVAARGLQTAAEPAYNGRCMLHILAAFLLSGLFFPAPEIRSQRHHLLRRAEIRLAMTEEALRRIANRNEGRAGDEPITCASRRMSVSVDRLPAGGRDQVLGFMRQVLRQTQPDEDTREFERARQPLHSGHDPGDGHVPGRVRSGPGREGKIDVLLATLEDFSHRRGGGLEPGPVPCRHDRKGIVVHPAG